jgi:hypothetical protein
MEDIFMWLTLIGIAGIITQLERIIDILKKNNNKP